MYLEQANLFNQALRLREEEKKEPIEVINRFFEDYRLYEWRHILWTTVQTCLTSDNDAFIDPEERANLLVHYEALEKVLEAAWLLRQEKKDSAAPGSLKA